MDYPAIEHRTSRPGRWLRVHRLRLALAIAVVEGLLVVFGQVSGWLALAIAALVLAFYVMVGRNLRSDAARQASWTAALSQVLIALVPVLVFVIGTVALIVIGLLVAVAILALLADRR